MANNYASILAEIKSKMESVTEVGVVYDYERYSGGDWEKFISLFRTTIGGTAQIRGGEISRVRVPEHRRGSTHFRHHRFRIRYYMGLKDDTATAKTFQSLVEDICGKFRNADAAVSATWYYLDGDVPENSCVQVEVIEERTFGSVLCHYAEIYVSITERIV